MTISFLDKNAILSKNNRFQTLFPSQSVSEEGKELDKTIEKVNQSIKEPEYIRKLIKYRKEEDRLERFIESLKSEVTKSDDSCFTITVINYSWEVWKYLSKYFSDKDLCLEVPDACPGQDNNFMYTWSRGENYLECEIFGSGEIEFFYRNRKNNQVWGEDTTLEQGFSTSILEKTSLFSW
ncbi:MAG TPA: hypothetical protein V6D19_04910 [Stenomitos sp.]